MAVEQEIIALNKRMLDTIAAGDYATYAVRSAVMSPIGAPCVSESEAPHSSATIINN